MFDEVSCVKFEKMEDRKKGTEISTWEEIDRFKDVNLSIRYFSTLVRVEVMGDTISTTPVLQNLPVLDRRTIEGNPREEITDSIKGVRWAILKKMGKSIEKKMDKVFSREREWDLDKNKASNCLDIRKSELLEGSVFSSLMTEHKIGFGYDFEEDKFLFRLSKQDSSDIEHHDSQEWESGCIDMIYSLRSYFREAKKKY